MPWLSLGIINPSSINWTSTALSAVDQDLVKITFLNSTGNYDLIKSRVLVRRKWDTTTGIETIERAFIVYPSPSDTVTLLPIAVDFFDAGLLSYRLEVKKLWARRWRRPVISEPAYTVNIQVQ